MKREGRMRETSVLIHDIGILITRITQVGVGLRVNYALNLLAKVVHHLSDRQLGSSRNKESDFHIWGDIASATSNLNLAVIFDNVPKENVKGITDELKQIAREFEVDEIHYKIDKELQDLIDFMNPAWKPKALDSD
jgi:hypothetical protein